MKERPILFNGTNVRAIRERRKTQTRRAIKFVWCGSREALMHQATFDPAYKCPYGQPGDRLWVRETWAAWDSIWDAEASEIEGDAQYLAARGITQAHISYKADPQMHADRWRPSIHMPRWASRTTLEIVSVRVERLLDISEEDAKAEGCDGYRTEDPYRDVEPREEFRNLWESINGPGSWDLNPWVWVIEFKEVKP